MKALGTFAIWGLAGLFGRSSCEPGPSKPPPPGEGFQVLRTDHFSIAYNTAPHTVRRMADDLEETYDAIYQFCKDMQVDVRPVTTPLRVILFGGNEDLTRYHRKLNHRARFRARREPRASARAEPRRSAKPGSCDPRRVLAQGRLGSEIDEAPGYYSVEANVAVFCDLSVHPQMRAIVHTINRLEAKAQPRSVSAEVDRDEGPEGQERAAGDPDLKRVEKIIPPAGDRPDENAERRAALVAQYEELVERFNGLVVRHEAAHQILYNLGVHPRGAPNPEWLVEGLATQFEIVQPQAAEGVLKPNGYRLADLREALGVGPDADAITAEQHQAAVRSKRWGRPAQLLEGLESSPEFGSRREYRYAQAWALVFYLIQEQPEAFTAYVCELAKRRAGGPTPPRRERAAFEAAFGRLNDAWEANWITFVLRLPRWERGRDTLGGPEVGQVVLPATPGGSPALGGPQVGRVVLPATPGGSPAAREWQVNVPLTRNNDLPYSLVAPADSVTDPVENGCRAGLWLSGLTDAIIPHACEPALARIENG